MKYLALLLFYISQINSDIYFVEENKILDERCKLIRTVEYKEKYWTAKRKDEYYETRCKEDEYCFDVNSRYRKNYQGEIFKINRKLVSSENLNDDVTVSNRISILADPFAYNNFHSIRYITWMGTKWKVSNVEVSYPRLIFDLGGVYNGETGPKQGTP